MKTWHKLLIAAVALVALFVSFKYFPHPSSRAELTTGQASVGGVVIDVEIVDTPEERAQGLSGREGLGEDEGMLFVLEEPGIPAFWMKDMRFAIDIVWIDSDMRVIGVERDILPETYPEIFRPSVAVKYVLELAASGAKRHQIDIGDEVFFAR